MILTAMIGSINAYFPRNTASDVRYNADNETRIVHEATTQGDLKQNVSDVISGPLEKPAPLSTVVVETMGVSIALEVHENQAGGLMINGQVVAGEQHLAGWYDAIVQFWQDGRLKRFTVVNNSGGFSCKAEHTHNIRLVAINRDGQVAMFGTFDFPEQNFLNE